MTLCFLTLWSSEWVESLLLLLKLACLRLKRLGSFLKFMWCDAWSNLPAKQSQTWRRCCCAAARGQTSLITSCLDNLDLAQLTYFSFRVGAAAKEKALIVLYAWDALFSLTLLLLSWEHQLEKTAFSSVGSHLKTPSNIQWCISNRSLLLLNKSLLVIVPSEIVNPKKRNRKCCYFSFLALPFSSNTRCTCERSLHLELDS